MESELGSLRGVSQLRRRYTAVLDAPNLPWRAPQGSSSDESFLPPSRGGVWSRQTLNPSTFKDRHPTDEEYLQMAKAERSRKYRKLEEAMARNENKKMKTAALECGSRDERVIESEDVLA